MGLPTQLVVTGTVSGGWGRASTWMDGVPGDVWGPLGYLPVPGTLNVDVDRDAVEQVRRFPSQVARHDLFHNQPDTNRYHQLMVDGVSCHGKLLRNTGPLEVVAPVNLRDRLGLVDGQTVAVSPRWLPEDVPGHLPVRIGRRLARLASQVPDGQSVVEVGAFLGRSTGFLASVADVFAVDAWDLPGPEPAPKAGNRAIFARPSTRRRFHRHLRDVAVADRVTAIQAFSAQAAAVWDGPPIGLLWIDADHSYDGVKADFEAWSAHLAEDAVVAFDDASSGKFGVKRFLDELDLDVVSECGGRLALVRP